MSKEPLDHIPPSAIGNPLSLFATNSGNITTFVCRLKSCSLAVMTGTIWGANSSQLCLRTMQVKWFKDLGLWKRALLGFCTYWNLGTSFFFYYWDWRCGFGLVLYGWLCVYTKNKIKLVNGMSLFRMLLIITDMSIFRDCAYNKTSMY